MKIAVTGSTGFVGSHLVPFLSDRPEGSSQHEVVRIVRADSRANGISWNPAAGEIDAEALEGIDGIIHLAGESIMGRWTPGKKHRIRTSRVDSTRLLSEAIAALRKKPEFFLCASAIGYYGDRGTETLTERSAPGNSFLSEVAQEWEEAADAARSAEIRVVNLRFGMILSPDGGALAAMLPPFRLGAGGRVGDGEQYWSWITMDDLLHAIAFIAGKPAISGPVNIVAPGSVRNADFTTALSRVLGKPAAVPLPAFAARMLFGQSADELMLASARVSPDRLRDAGFVFKYPMIEPALEHLLH